MKSILLTGGARSGKSRYAQDLAAKSGKNVLFVATAEAGDEEMSRRITAHKLSRPPEWRTLEAPSGTGKAISGDSGGAEVVVVDCITMLVNNIFSRCADYDEEKVDAGRAEQEVTEEIAGLISCLDNLKAEFIIVTNEVGLGLVPANPIDRLYRDLLGKANRMLAERVDKVYFMVAGLPLRVK